MVLKVSVFLAFLVKSWPSVQFTIDLNTNLNALPDFLTEGVIHSLPVILGLRCEGIQVPLRPTNTNSKRDFVESRRYASRGSKGWARRGADEAGKASKGSRGRTENSAKRS